MLPAFLFYILLETKQKNMAINKNELRIGNFVKHKSNSPALKCMRILELREDSMVTLDSLGLKFGMLYEDAEGIDLTLEILQLVSSQTNGLIYFKIWPNLMRDNSGRYDGFIVHIGNNGLDGELKKFSRCYYFLHQLQNIFFALTNRDLEINL